MKTKNLLKTTVLSALLLLCGPIFAQVQTFEWQDTQRQYLLRTPTGDRESFPVLFFLHGLGDDITRLDNEFHFQQVADEFQWAVVAPQALNEGYGTMWNAGLLPSSTDDSGFLMALLDTLAERYPFDLDRVFFTGFSMGGFMTHRIAIEHGDRIAACAPVSGLITTSLANLHAAPVKMLHIHGTADPVVGYDGGSQYFGMTLGLGVDAILDYWKNANHCTDTPVVDSFPDIHNDGLRFVRYTYGGDTPLQHIKVVGGNHTWYMDDSQYDVNYLTEIYRFFTTPVGNEGVAERAATDLRLWPNPTWGRLTIAVDADTHVVVSDLLGREVVRYALHAGTNALDLGSLPEGLYLVKDENGAVAKVLVTK